MLDDFKKDLLVAANNIPNWQTVSKLSLAKKYVEFENDPIKKNWYFSAFALRFWHEIPTLYKEADFLVKKQHWTIEDISDLYIEALGDVFKHRAFMNPEVFTYIKDGDEDKFINGYVYRAIDSTRQRYYQYYNYDKRKCSLLSDSLDALIEDKGDSYLEDPTSNKSQVFIVVDKLISDYINDNEIFTALLLYLLIYEDTFAFNLDKEQYFFSKSKMINVIRNMTQEEIETFSNKYSPNRDIVFDIMIYQCRSVQWLQLLYNMSIEKLKLNKEILTLCS